MLNPSGGFLKRLFDPTRMAQRKKKPSLGSVMGDVKSAGSAVSRQLPSGERGVPSPESPKKKKGGFFERALSKTRQA